MNLDTYPVISSDDLLTHSFVSEGPKGKIMKQIEFQPWKKDLYNLAFGDLMVNNAINDLVRSNNNDREKVLATVARVVITFMEANPEARIEVRGSTIARVRLYQMKLLHHLLEIQTVFTVEGLAKDKWEPIDRLGRYTAFSLIKKPLLHEKEIEKN